MKPSGGNVKISACLATKGHEHLAVIELYTRVYQSIAEASVRSFVSIKKTRQNKTKQKKKESFVMVQALSKPHPDGNSVGRP